MANPQHTGTPIVLSISIFSIIINWLNKITLYPFCSKWRKADCLLVLFCSFFGCMYGHFMDKHVVYQFTWTGQREMSPDIINSNNNCIIYLKNSDNKLIIAAHTHACHSFTHTEHSHIFSSSFYLVLIFISYSVQCHSSTIRNILHTIKITNYEFLHLIAYGCYWLSSSGFRFWISWSINFVWWLFCEWMNEWISNSSNNNL